MIRRTLVLGAAGLAAAALAGANRVRRDGVSPFGATHTPAGSPLVRPDVPSEGPPHARLTLVEFLDPAGEASRAFHPVVREIRTRYPDDVHLVRRYASFHAGSREGLRILEAARRQDRFGPVLEALYETQPAWAGHDRTLPIVAWDVAASAGLDVERGRRVAQGPEVGAHLAREQADAEAMGVTRAPTYFIDGRRVSLPEPDALAATLRTRLGSGTA